GFVRHKERKFGRGCLDRWRDQQSQLVDELTHALLPFEQMLLHKPFLLLEQRPLFVDFDLFGMLGDFLFTGHYALPASHTQIKAWYEKMARIQAPRSAREKLHS
ncbi:MAG: glutathione S-transferase C-terminal domain-containing protein, partial [Verrucomicrobiota bacterium]